MFWPLCFYSCKKLHILISEEKAAACHAAGEEAASCTIAYKDAIAGWAEHLISIPQRFLAARFSRGELCVVR